MLYLCTSGDVRESLGNPDEVEYSAITLEMSRRRATNLVNTYVQKVYPESIPFVASGDIPGMLETITIDLSVYYCKRDKHQGPAPLSDEIKEEYYDKSISLLEAIAKGDVELPELEGKQGDAVLAPRKKYSPTFGEGDELSWKVSQDKLADEADERD